MTDLPSPSSLPDRLPRRVRHELRFRKLEVRAVQRVTPHLVRITLGGDELAGFTSPGFDDHAKLFFPDPKTGALLLPTRRTRRPFLARRRQARHARLHAAPPRRRGRHARLRLRPARGRPGHPLGRAGQASGDVLGVGGPRGSFIVPTDFDWHLLIGDDTALPAISRRLAELPAGARVLVLAEVDNEADQIPLRHRGRPRTALGASARRRARHRQRPARRAARAHPAGRRLPRLGRLRIGRRQGLASPPGRRNAARIRSGSGASGYWRRGAVGHARHHED